MGDDCGFISRRPNSAHLVAVSILSSLLTPTVHPRFAVRFVSHESLLQAQNGGGGAIPYSPEVVVDVIANLVGKLDPRKQPPALQQQHGWLAHRYPASTRLAV